MAKRLFLERSTYRRNRLQDAARLLPVLGAALLFAPVFVRGGEGGLQSGLQSGLNADAVVGPGLAQWLVYYFAVWLGLIVLTALISLALVRTGPAPGAAPELDPEPDWGTTAQAGAAAGRLSEAVVETDTRRDATQGASGPERR